MVGHGVPVPDLLTVWPDTLVGCLNSIFPKFHSKEELSEFEFLGGEPAQELSFEISIFKITFLSEVCVRKISNATENSLFVG